jgi:anti-sigma B factor antagonist
MTFAVRTQQGVTILEPTGKITIGRGDIELRDTVDEAMAAGSTQLVVDFRRVTRMDSSGMAELVAAYKRITESGGRMKLLNLPSNIKDVLSITQIAQVFDIFDDESEALKSFE